MILYVWVKKDFWDIFVHTLGITQGVVSGVYDLVFVFSEGLMPGVLFLGFSKFLGPVDRVENVW